MRRKNQAHQQDIEDLKKQNNALESQSKNEASVNVNNVLWHFTFTVRQLEKAKDSFSDQMADRIKSEPESSDDDENHMNGRRSKKMKSSAYHWMLLVKD